MKQAEIKQIAILVADELERRQVGKVLNVDDLKKMFGIKTNQGIKHKINKGVPIRKKKGVGYYAFESEIIKFLKM